MHSSTLPDTSTRLTELGESIAELMHDLRGPLTTIIGFADLMSLEDDPEKRRDFLAEISSQVERLTRMSTDTLAFARGEHPVLLRRVQLYQLGAQVEQLLLREFCGTGIAPSLELKYRGPAELDISQLLRVVENLAKNAREAMASGAGSRFDVVVDRSGADLLFTFTDDGPGLPPEMRGHAFAAFATAGKAGGTGLGLHVVRRVALDHGGSVRLRDVSLGTSIELRVPCEVACRA